MIATVAVPTVQSILDAGATHLPFDLARVADVVYAISLGISVVLLFTCLSVIYHSVPNRPVPWRAVWPGAIGATLAIGVVDYAFPAYLTNISTLARFGTTIVFILIMLDLVLPAGDDHPRRRRRQRAGAERSRGSLLASRAWRPKRAARRSFTADG